MCIQPLNIHVHLSSYFFWGIRQLCSYPMQVSAPSSRERSKEPPARFMGDVESLLREWNIHEIKMRTAQMGADMRVEGWIIRHWAGSWNSGFSPSCLSCPMFPRQTGLTEAKETGQQVVAQQPPLCSVWMPCEGSSLWGNTRSPLQLIPCFASTHMLYKSQAVFLTLVNI